MSVESGPKPVSKPEEPKHLEDLDVEEQIERNEVLDEKIKNRVKNYSFEVLNKFLEKGIGESRHPFEELEEIEANIRDIVHEKDEDWDIHDYNEKYREAIKIFLDEYLEFCRSRKEDKNFERFLDSSKECLFAQDPNVTDALNVADNFDFIVKTNRLRDTQNKIGYHAFEGIEEKINFSFDKNIANMMLEKFDKSSKSEKFDILHVIEKLYSNCIQNGTTYENTFEIYDNLLNNIRNENKSMLIEFYIELIEMRLKNDYRNEFAYGDGYELNSNEINEKEKRESENIKEVTESNIKILSSERINLIGEDVLALFNSNNIPVKLAKVDRNILNSKIPSISNYDIRRMRRALDFEGDDANIEFDYFFDYFNDKILKPYYGAEKCDNDFIAEKWANMSDNKSVSKETYLEFINLRKLVNNVEEEINQYRAKLRTENIYEEKKERDDFYLYFKENASKYITSENHQENSLKDIYEEFITYYNEENEKKMTIAINEYFNVLNSQFKKDTEFDIKQSNEKEQQKSNNDNIKNLIDKYNDLCGLKMVLDDKTKENAYEFGKNQYEKYKNELSQIEKLVGIIVQGEDSLVPNDIVLTENINKELDMIQEGKDKEKIEKINVEFYDYKEFAENYGNIIRNMNSEEAGLQYQHLHRPKMKGYIEFMFNIDFKDIPFVYQVYFLDLLANKTEKEFIQVKNFIDEGRGEEAKNNRIKAFLSLESGGGEMGGKILNIGEKLNDQPEIADKLFSEYASVVDNINLNTDELCKIYEEIFFEKKLNKNEVSQKILERANNLFLDDSAGLEKASQSERKKIIEKTVEEFEKQTIANNREIEEFRDIAIKLKKEYNLIYIGSEAGNLDEKIHPEEIRELLMKPLMDKEVEFLKLKEQGLLDSADREEFFKNKILNYDENRIKKEIVYVEEFIKKLENNIITIDLFLSEPKKFINSGIGSYYFEIKTSIKDIGLKEAIIWAKSEKKIFSDLIKQNETKLIRFKQIAPFQNAFEKKLESLILGKETANLGKDIFADIEEKVQEYKPEKFPSDKQAYFPVGISSNLPEWEKIFEGQKKMAKPMDIYGYMFWLENQNGKIKLIVCDQMQASNYEALYDKTRNEALESAKKIGEREKRFYQKIIDTFGLKNIEIMDYESLINKDKDKFEKYKAFCERLSKNPIWEKVFSDMIQESVSQKTSNEEKNNLLKYAIEEVSWILSYDGVKVSHAKEARYDSLASIILNTKNICEKNGIDIFDPEDEKKITPILRGVIKELKNIYNTNKLNLEKEKGEDSCDVSYYRKMHETISKIKCKKDGREIIEVGRKDIESNFVCPTIGSFSFGWRGGKKGEKESTLNFKEAYSTYFCEGGANLFLNSDQVVTSPKGHIGGKILTLENDKQQLYAEKVIKPILIEYFRVLESASEKYFTKIKKTKEQLLSECNDSRSLSDILKFVQTNIMEPTFSV